MKETHWPAPGRFLCMCVLVWLCVGVGVPACVHTYAESRGQPQELFLKSLPAKQPRRTITGRRRIFLLSRTGRVPFFSGHTVISGWTGVGWGGLSLVDLGCTSLAASHSTLQAAVLPTVCHPGNQPSECLGFWHVLLSEV